MERASQDLVAGRAEAVQETKMASTRATEADAPETTNRTSSKEETMSATNETTHTTPTTENTGSENTSQPKVRRNRMRNVAQKINQLRMMAKDGRTREVICKELDIDIKGFTYLHHKLIDMDKAYYEIPCEKAEGRSGKVGKGGIHISSDRLMAMGANSIFETGTPITIGLDGDRLLIERADAKTSPATSDGTSNIEATVDEVFRDIHSQAGIEEVEA